MILALVNEQGQHVTLWHDYIATLTDPAHLLTELTITVVFALLELLFVRYLWKRVLQPRIAAQVHIDIDKEHGVEHDQVAQEVEAHHNCQHDV